MSSTNLTTLEALSPLDGRYRGVAARLSPHLSEYALFRRRVFVECAYLRALGKERQVPLKFSKEETELLETWGSDVTLEEAALIKKIETEGIEGLSATRHDVKAVEYFLKKKAEGSTLSDKFEWFHFGLTSEDTNNIAYALMLRDALEKELLPTLGKILQVLGTLATTYADLPMLARTHGQSASPTTFGKEMRVFSARLERQVAQLSNSTILAKLNGATGNYNALQVALPNVDWASFSKDFIEGLNGKANTIRLAPNLYTTQIESHDTYAELFDTLRRANSILINFSEDIWRYISDGWVAQVPTEGSVGSSTMPHKVNPIDFENAEGNLGLANALLEFFSRKLPISRLQRDLSDSTVERSFGTAFGHSLVAYDSLLRGLGKIAPHEKNISLALAEHPEVLAEAIQTILRREGVALPYEKLKGLTQGKEVTLDTLRAFIAQLPVSESVMKELQALTPDNYTGLASKLAREQ